MLFTASKVSHLNLVPQGQAERFDRSVLMVEQMDEEGFGGCTNIGECSAVCPKGITLETIRMLNQDLLSATLRGIT
jgi:succinate dehydrogenase / fumarate reductase iron-sulfur subunit